MKQFFSRMIVASSLGGLLVVPTLGILSRHAIAQLSSSGDLSYTFAGQQIPLTLRNDIVGVSFKQGGTRGGSPYQQLKRDLLRASTRGGSRVADVEPLGTRYAIITLPQGSRDGGQGEISQRVKGLTYVQSTVPVLTRGDRKETILLPNEIILSVDEKLAAPTAFQAFLTKNNLEVVRPIRFTKNRYVVRSKTASGTAILNIAKQLKTVSGVKTATPNFIQSTSYGIPNQDLKQQLQPNRTPTPKNPAVVDPQRAFSSKLLPLQWHLDSRTLRGEAQPRTDIQATEAWKKTKKAGKDTVVAVIDSLIQWDHPDLMVNLAKSQSPANVLPGEQNGWDFAQNDPDTRISPEELAAVVPDFQRTFTLSDAEFAQVYAKAIEAIKFQYGVPDDKAVALLRYVIRSTVASEFHGTWSAGVIAAKPEQKLGVLGVAPNAKILPVRVFGLNGAIELSSLVESIRYSAERKVDVINMSLGGSLPSDDMATAIDEVLKADPNLVIVASAGNDGRDGISYPAAFPGVVAVGATNLEGRRAPYSNFGTRLDVVAPGGDTSQSPIGGILTTGGTFAGGFWKDIQLPKLPWEPSLDSKGQYSLVQGTSFSGPVVAGTFALMRSEDRQKRFNREQLVTFLKQTASHKNLTVTEQENAYFQQQGASKKVVKTSSAGGAGGSAVTAQQHFFGTGLVNTVAAVTEVIQKR
jgi:serine protease